MDYFLKENKTKVLSFFFRMMKYFVKLIMQTKWPGNCFYIIAFCNDFQYFSNRNLVKQLGASFSDFKFEISDLRYLKSVTFALQVPKTR